MAATSTTSPRDTFQEFAGVVPDVVHVRPRRDLAAIELDVAGCAILLSPADGMRLAIALGELALAMEGGR